MIPWWHSSRWLGTSKHVWACVTGWKVLPEVRRVQMVSPPSVTGNVIKMKAAALFFTIFTRVAIYNIDSIWIKRFAKFMDLRFLICRIKQVFSFSRENLGPLLRSVRFHQLVTCWWGKGHWSAPLTDLFCSGSQSPHVHPFTWSFPPRRFG